MDSTKESFLRSCRSSTPKKQLYRFISFNEQYAPLDRTVEQIVWIYPVDYVIQKLRR